MYVCMYVCMNNIVMCIYLIACEQFGKRSLQCNIKKLYLLSY